FGDEQDEMPAASAQTRTDMLLDDAFGAEALGGDDAAEAEWELPGLEDNAAASASAADQPDSGTRHGLTAIFQESNFDWVNKQEEAVVTDDEMDDWLNQFGPAQPRASVTDTPDWLNELNPPAETAPDNVVESPADDDDSFGAADALAQADLVRLDD